MMPPSLVHRASFTVDHPRERVFAAWTDPAQLSSWFADGAQVELRAGGPFRFWGPSVIGAPGETDARQLVLAVDPPALLSFRWAIHDLHTDVELRFSEAEAGKTKLEVMHAVYGDLPFARPSHAVEDLWSLIRSNLTCHLADDYAVVKPDFTQPSQEIRLHIDIDAPPAKVWRALVEPELMNRWLGGAASISGTDYRYGWKYKNEDRDVAGGPTKILERLEHEKLVTDWPDWRGLPGNVTRVTWLLAELPGGRTRVTMIHDGFTRTVDRGDYPAGWQFFLKGLARVATA